MFSWFFAVFAVFAVFRADAVFEITVSRVKSKHFVSAVFAFSRGRPPHHQGPRHTFRMHSKPVYYTFWFYLL